MRTRILLDPQGGEGGGGGGASREVDLSAVIQGLIAKNGGDANKALTTLVEDNFRLREKNRDLTAKVPDKDAVILRGDDLKKYEAYRALGDDPKEVAKAIKAGTEAAQKLSEREKSDQYRQAAEVGGYKPSLFERLARQDGLRTEVAEEERDGKTVRSAFVVDEKGGKVALPAYAKKHWGEFVDALAVGKAETQRAPGTPPRPDDNAPAPPPGVGGNPNEVKLQRQGSIYGQW